ncbi:MAG: ABC transporter ATP-binding protein, partial [Erysipelotrichaceae bacterium]|nr:ABC transporter ATP-binding protein [Erysipelotrichaceae bacterium]
MFKLILKYTKQFKWAAILAPILVSIEVVLGVMIPRVMGQIIDEGINGAGGSNLELITQLGWKMVWLAVASMFFGAASGVCSAICSSGFIHNLRESMYEHIQTYSFANLDKFEVPSLVTRMTKDMREMRMAYISIIRMLVRSPLQLIMSTYMVFTINRDLAKVFFVAIPVLAVGLYTISHKAHPMFRILMGKFDRMNAS